MKRLLLTTTALHAACMLATPALADDAQAAPQATTSAAPIAQATPEIIVTAQKQSQPLHGTPAAVTALSQDALTTAGITDIRGVASLVPSAQFQAERGATKVYLRGVGTFLDVDSTDPAVAMNIDEVYAPREITGGALFDLNDVEVISGPQGTLYGRNAAGGAVNISTKDPTHNFGINMMAEGGNYNFIHTTGAVNVPVGDDVAVRAAFDYQDHDGYLSNGLNDQKSIAGRLKVKMTPTERLTVTLSGEYYHSGGLGLTPKPVTPSAQFPSDASPWQFNVDPTAANFFNKSWYDLVHAKFEYDLGGGTSLIYIPAYLHYSSRSNFYNGPGTLELDPSATQYTHELRLSHQGEHLNWVAGGYAYLNDGLTTSTLTLAPIPARYPQVTQNFNVHSVSYAGFGQATYTLHDGLKLTGGIRYSYDKRSGGGVNGFGPAPGVSFPTTFTTALSSSNVDYRVGVQYDISRDNMVYANFATGYNEGGFVPTVDANGKALTFRPQTLKAVTVGTKNRFWGGRLEINDELYYYAFSDYQVSAFNQAIGGLIIVNAKSAQMVGNDLTVRFKATVHDTLGLGLGLESARGLDFDVPASAVGAGNACACSGLALPQAPTTTLNADYTHIWDFSNGATLALAGDLYFSSSYWEVYTHNPQTLSPAYTRSNATLTYTTADKRWTVAAWVKNIENTARYNAISQPSSDATPTTGIIEPPRTFGLRFGVHI